MNLMNVYPRGTVNDQQKTKTVMRRFVLRSIKCGKNVIRFTAPYMERKTTIFMTTYYTYIL